MVYEEDLIGRITCGEKIKDILNTPEKVQKLYDDLRRVLEEPFRRNDKIHKESYALSYIKTIG